MGEVILGFDLSSKKIAMVALPTITTFVHTLRGKESWERASEAMQCMENLRSALFYGTNRVVAFIEEPVVARGGIRTTLAQAYVNGVVQGCLDGFGAKVHLVPVSTWKKVVVGRGSAQKSDVGPAVRGLRRQLWRATRHDPDLTDAAAIALYGENILGMAGRTRASLAATRSV